MRRHRKSLWSNMFLSIGAAVLFGIIIMILIAAVSSALSFFIMGSMQFIGFFAVTSAACGGLAAGYIFGKFRRRSGLVGGIICGAVLYSTIMITAICAFGSPSDIKKLLLLSISGAAGGVMGVNSKRPNKLID